MEKMLYFSDGTAGANASTEALAIPARLLKSMEPISTTLMHLYFDHFRVGGVETAALGTTQYSYVALTIGDGDFKEVAESITQLINAGPNSDGFLVVADTLNGIFCNAKITDAKIMIDDADTDSTN
tara:strand:+ start:807 stop:1184 length:378 start_codon:yes stop_codon:yes gene_type:complete